MINHTDYSEPLYEEIPYSTVDELIRLFSEKKDLMVLSSSKQMDGYGRYSYLCFDAFRSFSSKGKSNQAPFDFINAIMNEYKIKKIHGLPPLQGGMVGYFGYEASHYLEELPDVVDNIQLPDIYLNAYSSVIAVDHMTSQCWIIATGFPEKLESERLKKARDDMVRINLTRLRPAASPPDPGIQFQREITGSRGLAAGRRGKHLHCNIETCWAEAQPTSNFTRESYINAVNTTKEYILNGDIFQANISQQFSTTLAKHTKPLDLYFNLININPAPFSAFINIPDQGYIISASPERFIKLTDRLVETCPIKGTRKRSGNIQEDQRLAAELLACEKDHAENVMIVDLMRNDLSRVCESVKVDELCALKSFETVHHLVSKISATLKPQLKAVDLLKATFPPGSVTGAPKIRAMEIISELEMQARGPYCGCIGYLSFTGDMDTSVIIRTYFIHNETVFFSAGGAVVLDSDPEQEYQESLTKAQALLQALRS